MPAMRAVLAIALVGCAQGGTPDVTIDARGSDTVQVDASLVDMMVGPQQKTLSQTTSTTLEPAKSLACPATSSGTAANNYYRVFDLAAFGITTDFSLTQVSFQVEHCDQLDGTNGATVAVRVGTYSGTPGTTLSLTDMTVLASNPNVIIPEVIEDLGPPATTPGGLVNAPITATIPAGKKLFVEVDAPDGNTQYYFYMGANDDGEASPGYILAPRCNVTVPTSISTVSEPDVPVHLLLTVTGTY
jgi:hypothetical protein